MEREAMITDAMVEAGARVLAAKYCGDPNEMAIKWNAERQAMEEQEYPVWQDYRDDVRAALSAALDSAPAVQGEFTYHQAMATANARRNAARLAMHQIEFLRGDRKRAWDGDFVKRLCEAADSGRLGCLKCDGTMGVPGGSSDPHIPAYPDPCPDCDPSAPGFAPLPAPPADGGGR